MWDVVASAVDWFIIEKNKEVTVKNKFVIWTTDDRVAAAFYPYHSDPNNGHTTFVECRRNAAKKKAHYIENNVEIYLRN